MSKSKAVSAGRGKTPGRAKPRKKKAHRTSIYVHRAPARSARKSGSGKPVLQHLSWSAVELEALNPLFERQLVVGENVMLARILLKQGSIIPEHSHYNEQLSYILEGALKFWIDGREIVVRAGEVLVIPPWMPHRAEALADTIDLDIFTPPREDWIAKTDRYLRGAK